MSEKELPSKRAREASFLLGLCGVGWVTYVASGSFWWSLVPVVAFLVWDMRRNEK